MFLTIFLLNKYEKNYYLLCQITVDVLWLGGLGNSFQQFCLCIVNCRQSLPGYFLYFYREGILALTVLLIGIISKEIQFLWHLARLCLSVMSLKAKTCTVCGDVIANSTLQWPSSKLGQESMPKWPMKHTLGSRITTCQAAQCIPALPAMSKGRGKCEHGWKTDILKSIFIWETKKKPQTHKHIFAYYCCCAVSVWSLGALSWISFMSAATVEAVKGKGEGFMGRKSIMVQLPGWGSRFYSHL